jgi:hypothetical protein
VDRLLLHEFSHEYSGDHLTEQYHEALCRLGALFAMRSDSSPRGMTIRPCSSSPSSFAPPRPVISVMSAPSAPSQVYSTADCPSRFPAGQHTTR